MENINNIAEWLENLYSFLTNVIKAGNSQPFLAIVFFFLFE